MSEITYTRGDATRPQAEGPKVICHVCNDIGAWGKGFVLALSRRWKEPERAFREWHAGRGEGGFGLGAVQFVEVEPDTWVANMVGQHGIKKQGGTPPIRYEAVAECLRKVAAKALELGATVHMPRIGCGQAGGEWSEVEPLIAANLCERGVEVTVYDFEGG
jgi:O-acetyl-ADP-ribose deacetylase (regulator of RNase III)